MIARRVRSGVPPDGLTVTVGFGSTLFDDRFEIANRKPKHLIEMSSFPNDDLNQDLCGGDLLLQICAGSPDTAIHALRDIAKHTRGGMQILWRMDGFVSPARPAGVPRNHFGFMDGIANPNVTDPEVANRLMWVVPGIGEPRWTVGGTYHVCRIIRMFIEFWDRVSLNEQQTMIGRYRSSGNVLGTRSLTAVPDFAADPKGKIIPLSATSSPCSACATPATGTHAACSINQAIGWSERRPHFVREQARSPWGWRR